MKEKQINELLANAISEAINQVLHVIDEKMIIEAIQLGVKDAIWQVATSATDMPCDDFYRSIQIGVKEAMESCNEKS